MKQLSQIKERKEFAQFSSYSPIFEFHVNYQMYTPRKITNIEWSILSAIFYLKPNPNYKNMLLKDVFEHIYCIPLSEQLVYNELIKLYQIQRLINCRDSAEWDTIYLEDLELTEEGQEAFKSNKISTAPEEKIETYLFDPLERALVPNGAKGNCVESIPEQKELLALRKCDEVAFVLPEGLVRSQIEKKIKPASDTEISDIHLNTAKGEPRLLWNQLKVMSYLSTDGEIEIDMQKKQYIDYVNEIVMHAPHEILGIIDDPSIPTRKLNDELYPVKQILFSAKQQEDNVKELFQNIKGQRAIQYVSQEHYQTYISQYQKFKGTLIVFANELEVEHKGECLIVHVPQKWFANEVIFINNVGSNQCVGRFELNIGGKPIYAVFTYQLGREREQLFHALHKNLSAGLESELNDSNSLSIAIVMAGVFSEGSKGWQILRNRSRHLPLATRLVMYKDFLKFVSDMKIKNVPSVNEEIFIEMHEEAKLAEDSFTYWKDTLRLYPIGKVESDATLSTKIMETIELTNVSSYKQLQEVIQQMKELSIHVPTLVRECYRRLYTEAIAVEHYNEVQEIYNEVKDKGAYFDKDRLTEAWIAIAKSKDFFARHNHLSANEFCKAFIYDELIGVLQVRIREWNSAYEQLKELLVEQQLEAKLLLDLTEISYSNVNITKLKEWLNPFGKTIDGKSVGRLFVVDYLAVLENPKIIHQLTMKDTVLLNRDIITQMEKHIYSLKEEVGNEEKLVAAKELIEKLQSQSSKRINWVDALVELLPIAECIMGVEQSIALQYAKAKPTIVTANEHLYTSQGTNGPKIVTVQSMLENVMNQGLNEQQKSNKKKKK